MNDLNSPGIVQVESSTKRFIFGCDGIGQSPKSLYVTIDDLDGRPFRVFIKKGHTGLCNQALLEAVGRLLTLMFQNTDLKLDRICRTLTGITCSGGTVGRVSCMDALAKELRARYSEESRCLTD